MKDGLQHIIGKTTKSVIVTRDDRPPRNQVFLVFDDNTYFEFYGESFTGAGGDRSRWCLCGVKIHRKEWGPDNGRLDCHVNLPIFSFNR